MDLSERKLKILQAIISDFVTTAEPIGSRTLSKRLDMEISPATIRNEMSDLEEMGLLTHPHTSAGRVPSEAAYRLYVNELMKKNNLTASQKKSIASRLEQDVAEFNEAIKHAARVLSEITNLTSFALTPNQTDARLKYINLLPVDDRTVVLMIVSESGKVSNQALHINVPYTEENLNLLAKSLTHSYRGKTISEALTSDIIESFTDDIKAMEGLTRDVMPNFMKSLEEMLNVDLYMDGLTNIFSIPEFSSDMEKTRRFMEMVARKDDLTQTLINRDNGVIITIGHENPEVDLQDCTMITATYHIDGKLAGKIGVIGPTRMKYAEVTSVIEYLTDNISNSFKLESESDEE